MPINETLDVSKVRFYTYILFSQKDYGLYIGYTTNLKQRLTLHSKGCVRSTKFRKPFKLIHYEYFINKDDAMAREEFLKSGFGRTQLQQILRRTFTTLNHPSDLI